MCIVFVILKIDNFGMCLCNFSFGGIGKGMIICEIDVFDGLVGCIIDKVGV